MEAHRPRCPICGDRPGVTISLTGYGPFEALQYPFGACPTCGLFWCVDTLGAEQDYCGLAARRLVMLQGARLWDRGYFHWLLAKFGQPGSHVVECGSGPGWLGLVASQMGMTYHGYELDPLYTSTARDFLGTEVSTDGFLEAEAQADLVVMLQLIEHVGAPMDYLRKAYDLLRPGGRAIIATPNMAWGYLVMRATRALRRPLPRLDVFSPPLHITLCHPRTFRCIEEKVGFRRLRLMNNPLRLPEARRGRWPAGLVRWFLRLPGRVGLLLDSNLLYVAQKPG